MNSLMGASTRRTGNFEALAMGIRHAIEAFAQEDSGAVELTALDRANRPPRRHHRPEREVGNETRFRLMSAKVRRPTTYPAPHQFLPLLCDGPAAGEPPGRRHARGNARVSPALRDSICAIRETYFAQNVQL